MCKSQRFWGKAWPFWLMRLGFASRAFILKLSIHQPFSLQCSNFQSNSDNACVLSYHVNFAGILLACLVGVSLKMLILIARPNPFLTEIKGNHPFNGYSCELQHNRVFLERVCHILSSIMFPELCLPKASQYLKNNATGRCEAINFRENTKLTSATLNLLKIKDPP